MRKEQIIYLEKPGPQNTEDVIDSVQTYVARSGLKRVVVASTTGATSVKIAAAPKNKVKLVVVTHHTGFSQEGTQRFDAETRKMLEKQGVTVLTLSLIHISEPTRLLSISYAVFCLKKKKK